MKRSIAASCVLVTVLLLSVSENVAVAQFAGNTSRNVRNATRNFLYNRPTVSPYLNLTSRNSQVGLSNYFTQVRPQMEQRDRNAIQQRQSAQMQQQLNNVQNELRENQQQAAGMVLTGRVGWSSRGYPRFGSYMSFYPGFQRIAR